MQQYVFINGDYVRREEACISVFDRGFLMGDAIYEVTAVLDGKLIDFPAHYARLERSLREMEMENPYTAEHWLALHREIVSRNGVTTGSVYLEITRGDPGRRSFDYPEDTPVTVVMIADHRPDLIDNPLAARGWKVVTVPDLRWHRRDIKTSQLVYQAYAKMAAKREGADEAWMVEDGFVTEGTSNNAYIVTGDKIVTCPLSHDILHGITRATILRFAKENHMAVEERSFTVKEALAAKEAFATSATAFVTAVIEIDGTPVGNGKPGPISLKLRQIYLEESVKAAL